jgi:predicted ATPase
MIKVRVQDYQSLGDVELEIDGFTILTGANNIGKSSVIRAVYGLVTNQRGHLFVRYNQKFCEVSIKARGHEGVWKKGKGFNRYSLDAAPFELVGQSAPPEVLEGLGIHPLVINKKKIYPQFAKQMTGLLFLLNESGAILAETLSDVERVQQLNNSLRDSESQIREARSVLKVRKSDLQQVQDDLQMFIDLDILESLYESLQEQEAGIRKLENAETTLLRWESRLKTLSQEEKRLSGIESVSIPEFNQDEALKLQQEVVELESFYHAYREKNRIVESLLHDFIGVDFSVLSDQDLVDEMLRLEKNLTQYQKVLTRLQSLQKRQEEEKRIIEELSAELEELDSIISSQESFCPTCGRRFDD